MYVAIGCCATIWWYTPSSFFPSFGKSHILLFNSPFLPIHPPFEISFWKKNKSIKASFIGSQQEIQYFQWRKEWKVLPFNQMLHQSPYFKKTNRLDGSVAAKGSSSSSNVRALLFLLCRLLFRKTYTTFFPLVEGKRRKWSPTRPT